MLSKFHKAEKVKKKEESTMQRGPSCSTNPCTIIEVCSESVSSCSLSFLQDKYVSFGALRNILVVLVLSCWTRWDMMERELASMAKK